MLDTKHRYSPFDIVPSEILKEVHAGPYPGFAPGIIIQCWLQEKTCQAVTNLKLIGILIVLKEIVILYPDVKLVVEAGVNSVIFPVEHVVLPAVQSVLLGPQSWLKNQKQVQKKYYAVIP